MPKQTPILDALQTSIIVNRRDVVGQKAWTEWRTGLVLTGGTPAQAGDLALLGPNGKFDPSVIPGGSGGSTVSVNGTTVTDPNFNDTTPAAPAGSTNVVWLFDGSGNVSAHVVNSALSVSFSQITSGTNNGQTLTVGLGSTLTTSSTGVIDANQLNGVPTTAATLLAPNFALVYNGTAYTPTAVVLSFNGRVGAVNPVFGDYTFGQIASGTAVAQTFTIGNGSTLAFSGTGTLTDSSASVGTPGQVLTSTGTGVQWVTDTDTTTVNVNGAPVTNPNFNNATPAPPTGFTNVIWQTDGSGNVSAYVSTAGGGTDIILFPDDTTGTVPGYGKLTDDPSSIEQIGTATVTVTGTHVAFSPENSFASQGNHGVDVIPAGEWIFDTWVSVDTVTGNATTAVFIEVYSRTTLGVETLLFSLQTPTITTTTPDLLEVVFNGTDYFINPTDFVVVKYFAVRTTGNQTRTVSFYHAGEAHLSRVTAPIPSVSIVPFNNISSGVNNQATMTVDTGASIVVTGSGVVESTELATNTATPVVTNISAPTHEGMLLISQPGNASAVWADPLMQGLYPEGSNIASPPAFAPPTTIQPVLIGGKDSNGLLRDIAVTPGGAVVTVSEGLADSANHFAISTGSTLLSVAGPLTPILSLRPQVAATVKFFLTGMDVFTASAVAMFQIIKNGSLTGASFTNVTGTNAQQDTSATSVSGGTVMDTGYSTTGTRTQVYEVQFTVGDTFTLVVASDVNGRATKAVGALRWAEQVQPL